MLIKKHVDNLLWANVLRSCDALNIVSSALKKIYLYVVRCAIWYHLYNLKNVKNTRGGVLIKLNSLRGTDFQSNSDWRCVRFYHASFFMWVLTILEHSCSFTYRISSTKRPCRLLNFGTVTCGAYYSAALISKFGKWTRLNVKTLPYFL